MKRPVTFGKYLLLDRISVGGMAEVFQAKSFGVEGFEKILAIKRILPSMAEDGEFIEMFIDEAKIAGQLSHPNICQIFELGKIGRNHFIAMEFVWGKDTLQIQNRFRRLRRRMPLAMAALIAAKVCEGLDYAHRKRDAEGRSLNIIHRDVSPQNILVSYEGEVKIIDFGIATAVSRSSKTQAGVLKGKFGYMSPEQVRGLPLDRRSDLFALGTLLYEMCVGERLFTGEGDFAVLEKVRNADMLPPSSLNPAIPPELERIIMKALSRLVDDRYQGAAEMHEELMAFLMTQEPVLTSKQVAAALKEMFAREYQREREALDEYKKITRDALEHYAPTGNAELAVTLLGAPVAPQDLAMEELSPDELTPVSMEEPPDIDEIADDGATEIGGPAFADMLPDGGIEPIRSSELEELSESAAAGFDDEGMTQIYSEGGSAAPDGMPAEPTYIFNAEAGQLEHGPDQATVILADIASQQRAAGGGSNGGTRPGAHGEAQGPTVIFDASSGTVSPAAIGPASPVSPVGAMFTGQSMLPVSGTAPLMAPRSSVVKDMMIGVLLALVVILGVVVWRFFTTTPEAAPSTVVVSTTPPVKVVEVLIDGMSAGRTKAGIPFTRKVQPGTHRVAVLPPGSDPIVRSVELQPGQVKVVHFTIAKPVGHLHLSVKPVDDVRVLIDGAEVSTDAAKRPLELAAGQEHEVRVISNQPGYRAQQFKLRLAAGEQITRELLLERGQLVRFASEPAGAEVFVDGSRRGITPLAVDDLKPGKYRVVFKLEGHAQRSSWLKVSEGQPAELKLKLSSVRGAEAAGERTTRSDKSDKPGGTDKTAKPVAASERPKVPRDTPRVTAAPRPGKGRAPGFLVANTEPWAKVFIDGKDTGKTTPIAPKKKIALPPGTHMVTFVADGKRFNFRVTIKSGEVSKLIETLPLGK